MVASLLMYNDKNVTNKFFNILYKTAAMNSLKLPYVIANLFNDIYCISSLVPFPLNPSIKWEQITHTLIKHNNS